MSTPIKRQPPTSSDVTSTPSKADLSQLAPEPSGFSDATPQQTPIKAGRKALRRDPEAMLTRLLSELCSRSKMLAVPLREEVRSKAKHSEAQAQVGAVVQSRAWLSKKHSVVR